MRANPQVVDGMRSALNVSVGMNNAMSLKELAARLGCHTRRISEAAAALAREGYPVGSQAGVGYWRIANESERLAAIAPEVHRLRSIADRLRGLDKFAASRVAQLALDLEGKP